MRILFALLLSAVASLAAIIPSDRLGDWREGVTVGVVGGILTNRAVYTNMTGLNTNAAVDVTSDIQTALNNCPSNQAVLLPPGRFLVASLLSIPSYKTLRGSGMTNTTLVSGTNGSRVFQNGSEANYTWPNNAAISGSPSRGASNISVSSASGLSVGQLIRITQRNKTNAPNVVVDVAAYTNSQRQFVEIRGISGTNLTIWPPLVFDLTNNLGPHISYATVQGTKIGLEDLTISLTNNTAPLAVYWSQSLNSWAYRVRVNKPANYGFGVVDSCNMEFRECAVSDKQGDGSNHASFLINTVTGALLVNNWAWNGFPHVEVNMGTCGSAFVYNFFTNSVVFGGSGVSIDSNHAPHNNRNLYEGNVAPTFQCDGYFGSASHDTIFRNWIHGLQPGIADAGWSIGLNRFSHYMNVVGNVLWATNYTPVTNIISMGNPNMGNPFFTGEADVSTVPYDYWADWGTWMNASPGSGPGAGGFQELDLTVTNTIVLFENWNYKDNAVRSVEDHADALVDSYIYAAKPSWFGSVTWPPIGPDVTGGTEASKVHRIPAMYRYFDENVPSDPGGGGGGESSGGRMNAATLVAGSVILK